jgi:hypothetical protein
VLPPLLPMTASSPSRAAAVAGVTALGAADAVPSVVAEDTAARVVAAAVVARVEACPRARAVVVLNSSRSRSSNRLMHLPGSTRTGKVFPARSCCLPSLAGVSSCTHHWRS